MAQLYPTVQLHGLQQASFHVLHYLLELAETHAPVVDDAVQPSHSLWSPSPHALILSQHHDLFQWSRMDVRVTL